MASSGHESESKQLLEAQLRATLDVIPAYTWYAAPSGALTFVNRRCADYLGLPKDHPLRFGIDINAEWDSHIPLLHPDDHEQARSVWSTCLRTGCAGEATFRVRNAEGGYRWFLSRAEPLRAGDGTLLHWIGVNLEIEERKQAEFYLAEGERLGHMGSWVLDPAGFFPYWSRELFHIYGLDPAKEGPSLEEYLAIVHPQDREFMRSLIDRMFAEGSGCDVTKRILRPDGEVRYLRCVAAPIGENGVLKRIVGTAVDVTEQEHLTQELQRRQAYLAEAERLSHTGSFGWKVPSGEIFWSDETFRIFQCDPTTKPTVDFVLSRVHPDDRDLLQQQIDRASRDGRGFDFEHRLQVPDGSIKHVRMTAHPSRDSLGNLEFVGAATDVSEQRQAEAVIREQEAELRQMLDFTPQYLAVLGADGTPIYANRASLDYIGMSLDEWLQRKQIGEEVHPDDLKRVISELDRALSTGSPVEIEERVRKGDGSFRWCLTRCNPVRDENGQITRLYLASTDIHDRKSAEERLQRENVALREEIDKTSMFEEIVGTSPALRAVLSRISKVARSDSTVLITGETGTGKELVARAIHRRSDRSSRVFVSVNCAAVPRDLIASELFGHEKGSFTGATQQRLGRFELANGGTIFLDEVGELPAETQIALLRVLQEHEFERVGGTRCIRADVRVIAATNRDLQAAISAGSFRSDLFYRLHVFPIEIPPLRERGDDISLLVEYFIDRYARKAGKTIRSVDKKTLQLLQSYTWPGNIRELQNVIERSVIVCETETFSVDESWLSQQPRDSRPAGEMDLSAKVAAQEKEIIERALRESQGRVFGPSGAAAKLRTARSTLESKIRSLKIDKNRFKG